jgi:hypothetical protein
MLLLKPTGPELTRTLQDVDCIGGKLGGNSVLGNSANDDRPICTEKCGGKSDPPVGVGQARSKNNSETNEGLQ